MYNGHKNWNHWNVSLWINNDETLYFEVKQYIEEERSKDKAAALFLDWLHGLGIDKTPDGAPYSLSSIRAAIREI
jgi:hypothetical protein